MKINLSELKQAIQWIQEHTLAVYIKLNETDSGIEISCFDKRDIYVTIKIYDEHMKMKARILKEDILK